jgi:hypothetical protein
LDDHCARLADTAWIFGAGHDVCLDRRHLVNPQDSVVIEVALLDTPFCKRDLVVQDRGDAKYNATLDLSNERVGIHNAAAVRRNDDPSDSNVALIAYRDIGNAPNIASKRVNEQRNPASNTGAKGRGSGGRTPLGLLRNRIEHTQGTGCMRQQSSTKFYGVYMRLVRDLVEKALDGTDAAVGTNSAPESHFHGQFVTHIFH